LNFEIQMKEIGVVAVKVSEYKLNRVLKSVRSHIQDYSAYETGLTKVIGLTGARHGDTVVKDVMSYSLWLETYKNYPIIKIEGLEKNYNLGNTIHLFVHQQAGLSFNWHTDDVNVLLYVVKGRKTVYMKNRKIILKSGQSVRIPKGTKHRVFSTKHTQALSIGY